MSFLNSSEERPRVIPITKGNVSSILIYFGYSAQVAHKTEGVLGDAEGKGYVRSFLITPDQCLLCGSKDKKDLLIDVVLPNKEKTVYIFPICIEDITEAQYVRGDDSEINVRLREETAFLTSN